MKCQCITQKKVRCSRNAKPGKKYCGIHIRYECAKSVSSEKGKSKGKPKGKGKKSASLQCKCKTKSGGICSRKSTVSSDFCFQHQKCSEAPSSKEGPQLVDLAISIAGPLYILELLLKALSEEINLKKRDMYAMNMWGRGVFGDRKMPPGTAFKYKEGRARNIAARTTFDVGKVTPDVAEKFVATLRGMERFGEFKTYGLKTPRTSRKEGEITISVPYTSNQYQAKSSKITYI